MPKKKIAVRDKFYTLAKEGGYRARSAYKLIQLNRKYMFLEQSSIAIDLCAAPGGWLQVLAKTMPARPDRQIIGVDLLPIKPIPHCKTFQADITSQHCHSLIRHELKGQFADVVLCDGAPNVGSAFVQDAFVQADLALEALKFATEHLKRGGTFITKVFRSADSNALMWTFGQLFNKVEATKPASSRNVSAEIFFVCREYVRPDTIDPRLLDAKFVFAQVSSSGGEEETKLPLSVLLGDNKNKQGKFRDGYEEGAMTFTTKTLQEFVDSEDPVRILTSCSALTFPLEENVPEEIQLLVADLKLLGKADFKTLLKYREKNRIKATKKKAAKTTDIEEEEEDAEQELGKALLSLEESRKKEDKRTRKQANKLQRKKDQGMIHPFAVDVNTSDQAEFSLRELGITSTSDPRLGDFHNMKMPVRAPLLDNEEDEDEEDEGLDAQLEREYLRFAESKSLSEPMSVQDRRRKRVAEKMAKQKKSTLERLTNEDFNRALEEAKLEAYNKGAYAKMLNQGGGNDSSDEDDDDNLTLNKKWKPSKAEVHETQVDRWFQQPVFQGVPEEEEEETFEQPLPSELTDKAKRKERRRKEEERKERRKEKKQRLEGSLKRDALEVVPQEDIKFDDDDDEQPEQRQVDPHMKRLIERGMGNGVKSNSKPIQVVSSSSHPTVPMYDSDDYDSDERNTHLALGSLLAKKSTRGALLESAYNRYAFNDDALPVWFAEDESKHNRPHIPVTKEMLASVKARFTDMNDRPIKKVAEARARKQKRNQKKLSDVKRRANNIAEEPDLSSRSKMKSIEKLFNGAKVKRPGAVYVVSGKSGSKKTAGGKGTKGKRVKVVDSRMKKDMRKSKQQAKKKKH